MMMTVFVICLCAMAEVRAESASPLYVQRRRAQPKLAQRTVQPSTSEIIRCCTASCSFFFSSVHLHFTVDVSNSDLRKNTAQSHSCYYASEGNDCSACGLMTTGTRITLPAVAGHKGGTTTTTSSTPTEMEPSW